MGNFLMAVHWLDNDMWYALPLIIAVSLVYSATRHEETVPILCRALRFGLWATGIMIAILVVLALLTRHL